MSPHSSSHSSSSSSTRNPYITICDGQRSVKAPMMAPSTQGEMAGVLRPSPGIIMSLPSFASSASVALHSKIVQMTLELQQVQAETDDNNARADAMQEHSKHVVQEIDAAQAQLDAQRQVFQDEKNMLQLVQREEGHLLSKLQQHRKAQDEHLQRMGQLQSDVFVGNQRLATLQALLQWSADELAQWQEAHTIREDDHSTFLQHIQQDDIAAKQLLREVELLATCVSDQQAAVRTEALAMSDMQTRLASRTTLLRELHEARRHTLDQQQHTMFMIAQRDTAIAAARQHHADERKHVQDLHVQVRTVEHTLAGGARGAQRGRLQGEALQGRVGRARAALAALRQQTADARGHLATLTAAHHAAQQRCAQLHTTLTTSTTNLEQWAVKLQAVQQAVQDAQQALEAEQQRAQEGDGRCETLQALQQQETEQLARIHTRVASLRASLVHHHQTLAQHITDSKERALELRTATSQCRDLERRAAAVEELVDQQHMAAYQVDIRLLALEQQISHAEGWVPPQHLAPIHAALEDTQKQLDLARVHHQVLQQQCKRVQVELASSTRAHGAVQKETAAVQGQVAALLLEVESLQRTVEAGEQVRAQLLVQRDMAQLESTRLGEQLSAAQAHLQTLQKEKEQQEVQLQTQKTQAHAASVELRAGLHRARDDIHALTTALNAVHARTSALNARIETLQSKIALADTIQQATGKAPSAEEVLQGHSAYKAAMQQQLTTLEQQQQDLHEQITRTTAESHSLRTILHQLTSINRTTLHAQRTTQSPTEQTDGLQHAVDAVLREGEEVVTALEHAQGVGQAVQVEVQQTTQEHEKEKNMHAHVKQQEIASAAQLQQQMTRQQRAITILQRLASTVHKKKTLPQAGGGVGEPLSEPLVHTVARLTVARAAGKTVRDALRALQEERPEVGRVLGGLTRQSRSGSGGGGSA